jgi:hypothetical protein
MLALALRVPQVFGLNPGVHVLENLGEKMLGSY